MLKFFPLIIKMLQMSKTFLVYWWYVLFNIFVVTTLTEKQKRLKEVESIKEDASANYVSYMYRIICLVCKSDFILCDSWIQWWNDVWIKCNNSYWIWKGLCHTSCYMYLFEKLNWSSHPLNSKNNGPVLLFNSLFKHWNCVLSYVVIRVCTHLESCWKKFKAMKVLENCSRCRKLFVQKRVWTPC